MEGFHGRGEKNADSKWTEDRRKRHSEKMKLISIRSYSSLAIGNFLLHLLLHGLDSLVGSGF